jgi:hypothetical protein
MSNIAITLNSQSSFVIPKLRDDGSNWADYEPRAKNAMGATMEPINGGFCHGTWLFWHFTMFYSNYILPSGFMRKFNSKFKLSKGQF